MVDVFKNVRAPYLAENSAGRPRTACSAVWRRQGAILPAAAGAALIADGPCNADLRPLVTIADSGRARLCKNAVVTLQRAAWTCFFCPVQLVASDAQFIAKFNYMKI
jgi:hypothetical protein